MTTADEEQVEGLELAEAVWALLMYCCWEWVQAHGMQGKLEVPAQFRELPCYHVPAELVTRLAVTFDPILERLIRSTARPERTAGDGDGHGQAGTQEDQGNG